MFHCCVLSLEMTNHDNCHLLSSSSSQALCLVLPPIVMFNLQQSPMRQEI